MLSPWPTSQLLFLSFRSAWLLGSAWLTPPFTTAWKLPLGWKLRISGLTLLSLIHILRDLSSCFQSLKFVTCVYIACVYSWGFPSVTVVENHLLMQETSVWFLGQEDLLESCLESPMERSLVGYSPRGRKELDTTDRLRCSIFLWGYITLYKIYAYIWMKHIPSFCLFKVENKFGPFYFFLVINGSSLVAQMVKNPPAIQETWVWSLGQEDPLEKRMATHSILLAWRILWTEEPGGLQSMESAQSQARLNH